MSLSEFLRMARGKVEATEQKSTNNSTDLSSLHDDDLVELVWNDGQVAMQGQSNKAKKNPTFNQISSVAPGTLDNICLGNTSNLKPGKFSAVQALMDDTDIDPWLNSSIDDGCAQAYFSDLLPEISGVTANEPYIYGSFSLMNNKNSDGNFSRMHIRVNSELQNSSSTGLFNPYETNQVELSVPLMVPRDSCTQNSNAFFGNSSQGQTSENTFTSMIPEKNSMGASSSGSQRVLNFTNFSRPVAMHKCNLQKSDGLNASCSSAVKMTQNEEKGLKNTKKETGSCNEINLASTTAYSEHTVVKSPVKPCFDEPPDSVCLKDCDTDAAKGFIVGDKTAEPLLAASSSVCSGNSAELASNDQTHKRKDQDNEESDSRSEDNEEESVGRKKATLARGVSGSKRTRAAEVHNLSERRRRDRINEKMRALQELIPNCNKADKASMLDEAIEYLKSLQLQVQVMSMGAGYCLPPMMFPHMHAAHMPHFPQVGSTMGYGVGGMFDMNSGVPRFPVFPMSAMQGPRFSSPPMYGPTTYQGLDGQNFQCHGLPAHGLPAHGLRMSVPRASTGVSNSQQVEIHVDAPKTSPSETVNGGFDHPLSIQKDGTASINLTNTKDDVSSKEGSH